MVDQPTATQAAQQPTNTTTSTTTGAAAPNAASAVPGQAPHGQIREPQPNGQLPEIDVPHPTEKKRGFRFNWKHLVSGTVALIVGVMAYKTSNMMSKVDQLKADPLRKLKTNNADGKSIENIKKLLTEAKGKFKDTDLSKVTNGTGKYIQNVVAASYGSRFFGNKKKEAVLDLAKELQAEGTSSTPKKGWRERNVKEPFNKIFNEGKRSVGLVNGSFALIGGLFRLGGFGIKKTLKAGEIVGFDIANRRASYKDEQAEEKLGATFEGYKEVLYMQASQSEKVKLSTKANIKDGLVGTTTAGLTYAVSYGALSLVEHFVKKFQNNRDRKNETHAQRITTDQQLALMQSGTHISNTMH